MYCILWGNDISYRKMLNKILIILAIAFLAVSVAFDVNYIDYQPPVEHKESATITLKDFKGLKRLGQSLDGANEFAFIETGIVSTGKTYPYVKAVFYPLRSYVYNSNTIGDKNLLAHELYHFHITEYIARKIRKEISGNKNADADALLHDYRAEENNLQQQYDTETYHSYYMGKQLAWQHTIDSLLTTLKTYQ